jgi:nucleoside-diphosphate-sugar epimerase
MRILVSGASGFVGRALCYSAAASGVTVCGATRASAHIGPNISNTVVGDIHEHTDWRQALAHCDAVVHLAARVHVLHETEGDPRAAFQKVNVQGTLNLARQAVDAGVRRFIYISSIGVNGAETDSKPFTAQDLAAPHSPYAESKYEAEMALHVIAAQSGMEVVIIRPPLVYGAGAPGNFRTLTRWLQRGVPLPLGAIYNRRSFVALDNLVDLILVCLKHPAAANQTFLVSDGEDVSTTALLRRMAKAMGRPARLFPIPSRWLKLGAALVGKSDTAQRLFCSLQIDIEKTCKLLNWSPPLTLDDGLKKAALHETQL